MKRVALILLLMVGSGCVGPLPESGYYQTPLYGVASGTVLTLNQDILIAPDTVSVFIQDGEVLAGGVNRYYPYCKFEVWDKLPTSQRVAAGDFIIHRFTRHWTSHIVWQTPVVKTQGSLLFWHDGPSQIDFASFFFLQSAQQPGKFRLTCSHWRDLADGRFLSLAEIQQALGQVFTLRFAEQTI